MKGYQYSSSSNGYQDELCNQMHASIQFKLWPTNYKPHWHYNQLSLIDTKYVEQELPVRKQIRPRPSGFELN